MSELAISGLSKAFGGVHAVRDVSFTIRKGEFLAMIGPNGAGKSTCFNMINGQLPPDAGEIRFGGRNIAGLAPREIWKLGVGRTFQVAATFGSMTVAENVQMALISHAGEIYRFWKPAAQRHKDRALALLGRHAGAMVAHADDEALAVVGGGDRGATLGRALGGLGEGGAIVGPGRPVLGDEGAELVGRRSLAVVGLLLLLAHPAIVSSRW